MKNYNVIFTIRDDDGVGDSKTQRLQAPDMAELFALFTTLPRMHDAKAPVIGVTVKEIEA